MYNSNYELHQYYVSSTEAAFKDSYCNSRRDAEAKMTKFCAKNGLTLECVECDKHERLYSTSNGTEFCINRI